jgi:hypothetical protein
MWIFCHGLRLQGSLVVPFCIEQSNTCMFSNDNQALFAPLPHICMGLPLAGT